MSKRAWSRRLFLRRSVRAALGAASLTAAGTLAARLGLTALRRAPARVPAGQITQKTEEYEYIVIGSGAGGGPVAANLARAGKRVCLLEAGGEDAGPDYEVPVFHGLSTDNPDLRWDIFVEHYENRLRQLRDPKRTPKGVLYPRASTLGGCTAHNAMIAMYPDNRDWNGIASLTGDRSWDPLAMRRYFQRLERASHLRDVLHPTRQFSDPNPATRQGMHGWLNLEQTPLWLLHRDHQLQRIVLAAAREEGWAGELLEALEKGADKLDPNEWQYVINKVDGLVRAPKATRDGRRNGTRELLQDARANHGLEIKTHALCARILFAEGPENRAIGVEYLEGARLYRASPGSPELSAQAGIPRMVKAAREVIVAGGAFNSPQILMLSGIGPRELLEHPSIGIRTRVDLPGVGKNLQDRYEVGVMVKLKRSFDLLEGCRFQDDPDPVLAQEDPCMRDYLANPKDSLYGSNGVVIGLVKHSSKQQPDPDLFIFGLPGAFKGYYPGWARESLQPDHFTWAILKGHTNNTAGEIRLRSADPREVPRICFHYFKEGNDPGQDLRAVVEGVKIARSVNERFADLIEHEVLPGRGVRSDGQVAEFVQRQAWGHHASCSLPMGPFHEPPSQVGDPVGVVDSRFRVRGTQGLRVVDASVFPKIPGLFIVVPTYMIAEKASDEILKDAKRA
jgi:choline dehydrogenase